MRRLLYISLLFSLAVYLAFPCVHAQVTDYKGHKNNRCSNHMSGNKVRTIFYNYGLVGDIGEISGEWPIGTGNEYVGDVSPLVGVEFVHPRGDTLHSVITSDGPRGNGDGQGGFYWGFEPLPGFCAIPVGETKCKVALSNQPDTWPEYWPDKMYYDPRDPGWRRDSYDPGWSGAWNGYFGKNQFNADQETYFQMDDNADEEWFERIDGSNPNAVSWWEPNGAFPGETVTIYYNLANGTLPHSTSTVILNWGVNEGTRRGDWQRPPESMWPSGTEPLENAAQTPMTNEGTGRFKITIATSDQIQSFNYNFTDGENWDNNGGKNWNDFFGATHYYYFYPDSTDLTRRGCGIRVAVRGLQWSHFLAEDCIFWLYEITNIGTTPFDKVAFGMVVGTLSGGRQDSRDDLAWFDTQNDITYSWDSDDIPSPGWVCGDIQCVGYVGYAFLESPGNPYDGIDNDRDAAPSSPELTTNLLYEMTQPMSFEPGDTLVLIDYFTYERQKVTFPDTGSLVYWIREQRHELHAGQIVQENGRNNIDDNFNGLIDERLPDHAGLRYKNYMAGIGLTDPMIDESRDDSIDNDGDWDPLTDDVGADGAPLTGDLGEGDGHPTAGEPHFDRTDVDESDQIGLSAFEYFSPPGAVRMNDDDGLWERMKPGRFDQVSPIPEDGDFVYGSGYFPLMPGQTERFSMALVYGEDSTDIFINKSTVQQIYNENYNFARPPDKATVVAVPGDGRVTLYWDDKAERSFDPTTGYDFEGYKIYRATDPGFNEVFTITDGRGHKIFSRPIAQFDLNNGIKGFYSRAVNGASFFLGEDSGLRHVWTDSTVENGQIYYYAVCSYDHGDSVKNIFPAETSKYILLDEGGNLTTDINTVQVMPRAPAAGYIPAKVTPITHFSGRATGGIYAEVVDPRLVKNDHEYAVSFDDSAGIAYRYNVIDVTNPTPDTVLWHEQFVTEPVSDWVYDSFSPYYDSLFGLPPGIYDVKRYFQVYLSSGVGDSALFDGHRLYFLRPRSTVPVPIPEFSGWTERPNSDSLLNFTFGVANYPDVFLQGVRWMADYDIIFSDHIIDTAAYFNWYNLFIVPETPVYFTIRNLNRGEPVKFSFQEKDTTRNGRVDHAEVLLIFEDDSVLTWAIEFARNADHPLNPQPGDTLRIRQYQDFTSGDHYGYSVSGARVEPAAVQLDRIRVYPNPYLATSTQEPANPYSSGRGPRHVTFIHLPQVCTIRIYTVRGELVQTIHHSSTIDDGSEEWNLRTKDGLDAAYGIYIYHVKSESGGGESTGKLALIK